MSPLTAAGLRSWRQHNRATTRDAGTRNTPAFLLTGQATDAGLYRLGMILAIAALALLAATLADRSLARQVRA